MNTKRVGILILALTIINDWHYDVKFLKTTKGERGELIILTALASGGFGWFRKENKSVRGRLRPH